MDSLAGDHHVDLLAAAAMNHGELDLGAGLSLQPPHRLVDRNALGTVALDFHDPVAGHQSGPVGGRADQGAEDLQHAAVDGDLDPDPAELALYAAAEAIDLFRGDVRGVGVELVQYALDGGLDQLAAVDLLDVIPFHLVHRVDQELVQFVIVLLGTFRLIGGSTNRQKTAQKDQRQHESQGASGHRKTS